MSGQDLDRMSPAQQLAAAVRRPDFQEQVAIALPEGMPAARFVRIAATALLENPDIAKATTDSVWNALLKSAGDGLLPDGREAALVLFKPRAGPAIAQYMPMIGGFRKIAADHGWSLRTTTVYEADDFDYQLGMSPTVQHRPAPLGQDRGKIVAAYAVAEHRDGRRELEVMTAAEVDKVKGKAKTQAIWNEWPERMTEKTVGRRLFKRLPLGSLDEAAAERVRSVLHADELEPGEAEALVYGRVPLDNGADSQRSPVRESAAAPEQEPPSPHQPAAPAAFTGDEPPPKLPAADPAPLRAAGFTLPDEFTSYAGELMLDVLAVDRDYVEWLASDAIADEEVRAIAAEALEASS